MKIQKFTGSYYTPTFLTDFIVENINSHIISQKVISLLEPSVGNGIFIKSFNGILPLKTKFITFTAIEKNKYELKKAIIESKKVKFKNLRYNFFKDDLLKIQKKLEGNYSFILGNPPYIRKRILNNTQIKIGNEIFEKADISKSSFKNIWTAFLIKCSDLLDKEGILYFVLPTELLQVKFSREIRSYLIKKFERIEIFTFDELIFDKIEQDTILLICYKKHKTKGQYFVHIKNPSQLKNNSYTLSEKISLSNSSMKWSNHILSNDEIQLMIRLKESFKSIDFYCNSKPGIVTAANDFFIINNEIEKKYELSKYTYPILKKGFFVNGDVVFDEVAYELLVKNNKPTKLINLNEVNYCNLSEKTKEYIRLGKKSNINKRYKCSLRSKWFAIPNIGTPPDGFFFKRIHQYPKLMINEAKVLVTDSAYIINMRDKYSIKSFVYSFYNSLTLAFTEMEGRYYGGGVLELTPNEYKSLPIPYYNPNSKEFKTFQNQFKEKNSIEEITNRNDSGILFTVLNLSTETISIIKNIYGKLIDKRLGIN